MGAVNRPSSVYDTEALRSYLRSEWAPEVGRRVSARREQLGLSLEQVAVLADCSVQTISMVERGRLIPRDYMKVAVAAALGMDAQKLFAWPSREKLAEVAA